MRLYKIMTHIWGKDLHAVASLGYVVAKNEEDIYEYINKKYKKWPESVDMTREAIIAAKGDFKSECTGEYYDQKYGWEDLGEISAEDIAHLNRLKILGVE